MKELIDQFIQNGLTPQQAAEAISAVNDWLKEEYPVAGVLMESWMKNEEVSKA